MPRAGALTALFACCLPLHAAQLPLVRAHSPAVDIQDGYNLRKGFWTIDPTAQLDVYYAQRSSQPKQVRFITDIDALTLEVRPGAHYDFVVSLDGKDCPTRISTLRGTCHRALSADPQRACEIPFTLGRDGKLHVHGRINGSDELDMLFDVGSDALVLYPSARAKHAQVVPDGTIVNSGMGGETRRATSNDNRLDIAELTWEHELVMSIDTQADAADGIVGFNVFEDKVVAFDYARSVLTIHDALPAEHGGFTRAELRFEGTLPHGEATLGDGKQTVSGWFAFDTAYNGSVYLARELVSGNPFLEHLELLGRNHSGGVGKDTIEGAFVVLPELKLGAAALREIPISIETSNEGAHHQTNLLGMDVLKRFEVLLDFQKNEVWWKPNASFAAPFEKHYGIRPFVLIAVIAIATMALGLLLWRRRRSRSAAHAA